MTNAVAEMKQLREGLVAEKIGIEAELTTFPTGSAMLDVRRGGRAFVMAYTPDHGYGVDEIHGDDGFISGYRFVSRDFPSAARELQALTKNGSPVTTPAVSLTLIVLRSANIEAARDFYGLLGLSFADEQHGDGPRHYSATMGPLVLEIYPCEESTPTAPVRLGFRVPLLDQTLAALRNSGARIVREAKDSPWGRRALVEDPDRNRIELT